MMSSRWKKLRAQVLAEEGGVCWLCLRPGANSVDHVIPVVDAPWLEYERGNCHAAHLKCNKKRGTKPARQAKPLETSRTW
jgi:5-methylcytosine-specific restriction endonuclease McrA